MKQRRSLDVLVTDVATHLMGVDASTVRAAYTDVLQDLVDYFEVDASYLRHNDHELRATVMVAEWPPRLADPDPIGVVYFADADPVFAQCEFMTEPTLFRPDPDMADYRRRVREGTGYAATSMATVPLVSRETTMGLLGFVKSGDRSWSEDEINALKAIASLFTQLQARIVAEESLRLAAMHDALTGLANRRGLAERVAERSATDDPIAVLFLDLDRLKALNDFLGHGAGDDYLRTVSHRLRDHLGQDGVVARWGGDEFVIVLAGPTSEACAVEKAGELLEVVTARVTMSGEYVSRTASIGVALGDSSEEIEVIVARADQAALAAKMSGGNTVTPFDSEIKARNELHNDIELHLRSAIENQSLLLYYQPEVDLVTGNVTAVEALVRWQHPTRGLLPPSDFIAIAEASNLATELGRWVLDDGCRMYNQWLRAIPELDITLRVNVSPAQLLSSDFVDDIRKTLNGHDMNPGSMCIEITEVAVVHDVALAAETLRSIRALGVRVAIDDFGTGYSSLSHLKVLPVDAIKIDREFVEHLGSSHEDQAIVEAIVTLAQAYGLDLIAEGVETIDAKDALVELGCTRAQGYLYSKPVPSDVMLKLLRHGVISPDPASVER